MAEMFREDLGVVSTIDACRALLTAVDDASKSMAEPSSYGDWQSYARSRDKVLDTLASAVVSLLRVVVAQERERGDD